jgi:hypothetical protein
MDILGKFKSKILAFNPYILCFGSQTLFIAATISLITLSTTLNAILGIL